MKFLNALKLILGIRCEHAARLLSRQCEGSLSRSEKVALWLHVSICKSCKRYKKQLLYFQHLFAQLRHRLFSDESLPKAPKDLRDRIIQRLRKTDEK